MNQFTPSAKSDIRKWNPNIEGSKYLFIWESSDVERRSQRRTGNGAAGSDASIEAADIALMTDQLSKLPWLIRHLRRTLYIINENITDSIAIKVVFVAPTFAGHASLWAVPIGLTFTAE